MHCGLDRFAPTAASLPEGIHVARGIGIDDETANRAVTLPMKAYGMIDTE
jgi:hypothetical protein